MRELEAALRAAGDPTRAWPLKPLEGRESCVCREQAVLGLVEDRREGRGAHDGSLLQGATLSPARSSN